MLDHGRAFDCAFTWTQTRKYINLQQLTTPGTQGNAARILDGREDFWPVWLKWSPLPDEPLYASFGVGNGCDAPNKAVHPTIAAPPRRTFTRPAASSALEPVSKLETLRIYDWISE